MAAKSILNEFFQRIRTAAPVYKTQAAAQEADGFVCSLTLPAVACANGDPSWALQAERCFTGTGASKKEAEHAAANAAVAFMTNEGLLLTQQPLITHSSGCSSKSTSITPVGSKRSKDVEEDEPENLEYRILDALSSIYPKSLTGAQLAKICGHFKLKSKVNHLLYVRLRGQNLVEMVGTTPPPAWRATQAALDTLAERPESSSAQGPLLECGGSPAPLLMLTTAEQQQQQEQQDQQQLQQAQAQRAPGLSRLPSKRATSCSANSGDASGQGAAASADTGSSHGGHASTAVPSQHPPRSQQRHGSFGERRAPIIGFGSAGIASSSGRHDRMAAGTRPASKYARTAQSPQLHAGLSRRAVLGSPQRTPPDASTAAVGIGSGLSWGMDLAVPNAALSLQQQQAQLLHMAAGWQAGAVPAVSPGMVTEGVAAGAAAVNAAMPGSVPDLVLDTADLFAGHNLHGSSDAAAPYMLFGLQFNAAGPVHVDHTGTHAPAFAPDAQTQQQPLQPSLQQSLQQQQPQQQQQQQLTHLFPHILSSEAFGAHLQQYSGVFSQGLPFGTQQWASYSPSLSNSQNNSQSRSHGPSHSQQTPSHNTHSLARAGSNAAPAASDSDDDNISPAVMAAAADAASLEPAPLPTPWHPMQGNGFRAQHPVGWQPAPGAARPIAVTPPEAREASAGAATATTHAAATAAAAAAAAEHAAFQYPTAAQPASRLQSALGPEPSTQRTRSGTEAGIKRKLPADSAPQPGPVPGSASRGGLRGKALAPSFRAGHIRVVSDESDGDSVQDDGCAGNEHSAAGLQAGLRRRASRGGGAYGHDDGGGSGDEGNDSCGASGTTEKRLHMTELAELLAGSAAIRQLGGAQPPGELCSEEQALQLLSKLQLPETPTGGGASSGRSAIARSRNRGTVPPALQDEYERQKGIVRDLVARLNDALVGLKSIKEMAGSGDEDGEGNECDERGAAAKEGSCVGDGAGAADV